MELSVTYRRWSPVFATTLPALESLRLDISEAHDLFVRLQRDVSSADYLLADALAAAAVIRYSRAFGEGARDHRLHIDSLPNITSAERSTHSLIKGIRDKHVAHAVSAMETNSIYVGVAIDTEGRARATHVSAGTATAVPVDDQLCKAALALCARWLKLLDGLYDSECERLLPLARQISSDELIALPLGPVTPSQDPNVRRPSRRSRT
jgi:hypothetical protein